MLSQETIYWRKKWRLSFLSFVSGHIIASRSRGQWKGRFLVLLLMGIMPLCLVTQCLCWRAHHYHSNMDATQDPGGREQGSFGLLFWVVSCEHPAHPEGFLAYSNNRTCAGQPTESVVSLLRGTLPNSTMPWHLELEHDSPETLHNNMRPLWFFPSCYLLFYFTYWLANFKILYKLIKFNDLLILVEETMTLRMSKTKPSIQDQQKRLTI